MAVLEIEGYASVYGVVDNNAHAFMPGVFSGWLAENPGRQLPLIWYHSGERLPIGITTRLWEDDVGLGFEAEVADTRAGRDVAELLLMGAANGVSFRFFNGDGFYDEDFNTVVTAADIDEVSLMAPGFQANPLATAGVAGEFTSVAVDYLRTIEAVRRAMQLATAA